VLQCELDLPHVRGRRRDPSEGGWGRRRVRRPGIHVRAAPLRMIERVERFTAELDAVVFGKWKALDRCEIHIPSGWTDHRVTPSAAKRARRSRRECGRIEPFLEGSLVLRQIR